MPGKFYLGEVTGPEQVQERAPWTHPYHTASRPSPAEPAAIQLEEFLYFPCLLNYIYDSGLKGTIPLPNLIAEIATGAEGRWAL